MALLTWYGTLQGFFVSMRVFATEVKTKKNLTPAKKGEIPSLLDCGVFASEVN